MILLVSTGQVVCYSLVLWYDLENCVLWKQADCDTHGSGSMTPIYLYTIH